MTGGVDMELRNLEWAELIKKFLRAISFFVRKHTIAVGAVTMIMFLSIFSISWIQVSAEDDNLELKESDELIYLLQVNLASENLDMAKEYLDKIYQEEGDSALTALISARIELMYGNFEEACILYQKAEMLNADNKISISQEEQDFYKGIREGSKLTPTKSNEYKTMISYLQEQGLNPEEYGYEKSKLLTNDEVENEVTNIRSVIIDSTKSELRELVEDNEAKIELLLDAVDLAKTIEKEYINYLENDYFDEEIMSDAIKDLSKIYKKASTLFNMEDLDEAYIKGMTLLEDYKDLIDYAEKSDSQFALAMVANLYTSDKVSKKDFSDDFVEYSKEEYNAVIEQCEEAIDRLKSKDLDDEVMDELDLIIESLETLKKNPILAELDNRMRPEAIQIEDQSKIYLQKTNVNYEIGDNSKADKSFQAALDTAPYSDDLSYVEPMNELVNIINSNADSEEIKNTGDYLNEAYQNSLPAKTEAEVALPDTFARKASEYISTKKAMLNIGYINTSDFPTIRATVQFSSPIDVTDPKLTINDCNQNITDFKIEKQVFNNMRVYLVCDISGSMGGSEGQLQEAVRQFMSTISTNEEVALLGFSSGVEFDSGFTRNSGDLEPYIAMLNPSGGTDIGTAAYYSIDQFLADNDSSNVIILMTDGNDSSFRYKEELIQLKRRCEEKNILLYTIGLGSSISAEYLENIASYGNGRFVYSNDAVSLQSLYDFIHKQIDNNYLITFEAKNMTENVRQLEITNQADGSIARKTYVLSYEEDSEYRDNNSEGLTNIKDAKDGVYASGVDSHTIYMSDKACSSFNILGKGFLNVNNVNVSLQGNVNYNSLNASIVDDGHIKVEMENVKIGTYTVVVSLDNQLFTFEDAITVMNTKGSKSLKFGAYEFSAAGISYKNNECILSGNVVMNDFIHFKGNVTLSGDLSSNGVRLTDTSGSYINFKKELTGMLKSFFGNTIYLPPMGSFTIYNDLVHIYDLDNYKTEQLILPSLNYSALTFENPYIALYPHKIEVSFGNLNFDFPLQKELLQEFHGVDNPFTVSGKSTGVINGETLGVIGEFSASKSEAFSFSVLPLHLSELEFEFNTFEHNYKIKMAVETEDLIPKFSVFEDSKSAEYSLEFAVKEGTLDEIDIHADIPIMVVATPPISVRDFQIGASDISKAWQENTLGSKFANIIFKGGLDVSVLRLSDIITCLSSIFDDVSLVTLDDTTANVRFSDFMLKFKTTLKLFGEIEIGETQLEIGSYEYSNYLLGIDKKEASGFQFKNSRGLKWDQANIKINIDGSITVSMNEYFTGVWARGLVDYDIKFLGRHHDVADGNALIGLHNKGEQFTISINTSDLKKGKRKEHGVRITISDGSWIPKVDFY